MKVTAKEFYRRRQDQDKLKSSATADARWAEESGDSGRDCADDRVGDIFSMDQFVRRRTVRQPLVCQPGASSAIQTLLAAVAIFLVASPSLICWPVRLTR